MDNINFAQILDGLEKDVLELVSNLEMQINGRLATAGSDSPVAATPPVKSFQPKWRGLRGVLRWLWKGHSKDNPDYAHLYGQDGTRAESRERRPTLAEYLAETRVIEGFADEIFMETFGTLLTESSINISDLVNQFKMDFRNVILKYKNLIRTSMATPPAEAPAATDARPVSDKKPESPPKAPESPAEEKPASRGDKGDKSPNPATTTADKETKTQARTSTEEQPGGESEKPGTEGQGGDNSESEKERKPKGYAANMKKWFKEAMEAKKKGGDELKPKQDWLNPKGIIKTEKLPWVIAWMGTKSHKDLHKDEDVRSELASVLGASFKDFVPKIGRKKSDSLVGFLRRNMPMVSDEEFKSMVSELYGSEYQGSGASEKKKDVSKEPAEKKEEKPKPHEPTIREKEIEILSSLYSGADSKEQILDRIQEKIIRPTYYLLYKEMGKKTDADRFGAWWKKFKEERMDDKEEDVKSMIARINNGVMLKLVIEKSREDIDEDTLMDMLTK